MQDLMGAAQVRNHYNMIIRKVVDIIYQQVYNIIDNGGASMIDDDDVYFWVVYANDDKDTIVCAGSTYEVAKFIGTTPKAILTRYYRRDRKRTRKKLNYIFVRYLSHDLDKEDDL